MKKITLLISLLGITASAHAESYSSAVSRDRLCSGTAMMAKVIYQSRINGEEKSGMGHRDPNPYTRPLNVFMEDYAYDSATSEDDAYMTVWAKCMDNIDMLLKKQKYNQEPYTELPR